MRVIEKFMLRYEVASILGFFILLLVNTQSVESEVMRT